jgi:hypothetical protein
MKVSELRIGNWVKFPKPDFGYLNPGQITLTTFADMYDDDNRVEPIPLSEEWLLKFGFEKITYGNGGYQITSTKGKIVVLTDNSVYVYSGLGDEESYGFRPDIDYVHQLQNLYYSLTSQELTIKE